MPWSLLERVGMADQARKLPSSTSGGQQQRVAVARALANDPPLLVADEPTGNLDSATADVVFELFDAFVEQGRTIVTVTHDAELAKRTRRVVHMADGEITDGTLDSGGRSDIVRATTRPDTSVTPDGAQPEQPVANARQRRRPSLRRPRMRSVRWRKVFRDLGSHTMRTVLVVLSIAVGVFAVGTIAGADAMLQRNLTVAYANSQPGLGDAVHGPHRREPGRHGPTTCAASRTPRAAGA